MMGTVVTHYTAPREQGLEQKMKEIGTKVYYTGDMANHDGFFVVTAHRGHTYDLREIDGTREFLGVRNIADVYNGTCSERFVTAEAHQKERSARIEEMRRAVDRANYLAHQAK